MKKTILALAVAAVMACTVGCQGKEDNKMKADLFQFEKKSAVTAVMHTTMGDVTLELYPDKAPKTVENFIALAQQGYYDGVVFHRVINDFMIQSGDPTGTGSGGESSYGKVFADEFDFNARNYRGALSMANYGVNTNSSQFFIVQRSDCGYTADTIDDFMLSMYTYEVVSGYKHKLYDLQVNGASTDELNKFVDEANGAIGAIKEVPEGYRDALRTIAEKYIEVGGTPHLDFGHTVFGMVTEGMDIVDSIAAVDTDSKDKPKTDVVITGITINK